MKDCRKCGKEITMGELVLISKFRVLEMPIVALDCFTCWEI
jgi:hypothetical protein